jgi:hypothetical protein
MVRVIRNSYFTKNGLNYLGIYWPVLHVRIRLPRVLRLKGICTKPKG